MERSEARKTKGITILASLLFQSKSRVGLRKGVALPKPLSTFHFGFYYPCDLLIMRFRNDGLCFLASGMEILELRIRISHSASYQVPKNGNSTRKMVSENKVNEEN